MNINIGALDSLLRVVLGATLLALALFGTIGAWGFLGIIPLATGLMRRCPAYRLFSFSTASAPRP